MDTQAGRGPGIALIRPLCEGDALEMEEPLGAEAICGYLRERGLDARVFDRRLGEGLRQIEAYGPAWVGFSLMTAEDAPDALRLLQLLRRQGRRFFAGGLFVTTCPARARALFPADTVLIAGEGEGPVWELVTRGSVLGRVFLAPDAWAFASRDNLEEYLRRGGVINIRTSRGCRGCCAFCTTPREGRPAGHQTRRTDLVAEEMLCLSRSGHEAIFHFTDDMFGDHLRIEALIRALEQRGLRAAFSLEMRAQEVLATPPALWPRLHEGGLCRVFTGLESLMPQTLAGWKKPLDGSALLERVNRMRQGGIACEVGYILWHDGTEEHTAWQEAEALYRHGLLSPKTALSRLVLFPGSQLHARQKAQGVTLCPLRPGAARLHAQWQRLLAPIVPLWTSASRAHPKRVCQAFLARDAAPIQGLEEVLDRLRGLTWRTLTEEQPPSAETCESIRRELYALHIACA